MSEAMFDLLYIMDILIRLIMMITITIGVVYWIRGPRYDEK